MPQIRVPVPEYGEQRVKPQAVPGVRVQQGADVETFGGGPTLEKVGSETREIGSAVQKYAITQQKAADEVAVQDADLQAGILQNKIQSEALKLTGKNAAGAKDYLDNEWKKGAQELNKGLSNDRQRSALSKKLYGRYVALDEVVQRHMAGQFKQHDSNSTNAFIENARNEGVLNASDPKRVSLSIFQQEQSFLAYAKRNGLSDDEIKNKLSSIKSDTHVAVIDGMLSAGQIDLAKSYYAENKKQIVGEDAKKYPDYLDARSKRLQEEARYQKEQSYDANMRKAMLDSFDGQLTLSEIQRRYRSDEIKESDYNLLEKKVASPEFEFARKRLSDPISFNDIRQAQIEGTKTPGEIDRMIAAANVDGKITSDDSKYLVSLNKGLPPSPKDQKVQASANSVRDFGMRYLSESLIDKFINKDKKNQEVESIVTEFYRRIDKENADGERIDEIAKEVIGENVKKNHPEIARLEDIPHIIVDVNGKVQKLLNPDQKTKAKPRYSLVPNKIQDPKKEPKKEK